MVGVEVVEEEPEEVDLLGGLLLDLRLEQELLFCLSEAENL
jgi:hypothetical protein